MKSPVIKVLCRVLEEFSQTELDYTKLDANSICASVDAVRHLVKGIAYAVVGNEEDYEEKAQDIAWEMSNGTPTEIINAVNEFVEMASLTEVFQVATSAMKFAEVAAKAK